ncbi:chemotaxis protein CheA [Novosphingobium sp. SG707]|uniref:chemotaxis protein CheA n=1 Tax=Novosphingobium sp. SG707 TaxID=2586996 RepID=UPI001447B821|nr:chemotaxis protein CheA [Novosphingobium sp. SG707]NKI99295.1 two-component system chemotaxis sensor kinase CheA [Novosphingobium sp. SG707]
MSEDDPVAAFRVEAAELLDSVEAALLDLAGDSTNTGLVDEVFRGLHTLKGSGAMFGFEALARFTHHCETAFDRVRKGHAEASQALIGVVLSARDHMQALIDVGTQGDPMLEVAGEAILSALEKAVANSEGVAVPRPVQAERKGWHISFKLPPGAMVNGTNPLPLLDELRELGDCRITPRLDELPPLASLVPTECYIYWDIVIEGDVTCEDIEDVFIFVIDDMDLAITPLIEEPESDEPVEVLPVATVLAAPQPVAKAAPPAQESVRVAAERLDELMNRVGELVIAQSRLAQLASSVGPVNELTLRAVSEDIERLSAELRDTTMAMRMMPVGNLFGRFRRLVHDLARETGKTIELVTHGEATEVDKTVIERLADPMIHLIRNSCDHGLEAADDRVAAGKPVTGRLTLSARQAGGEVLIAITDDGKGIDRERVRAKAEAQGLIQPGAILGDGELFQMIFHPGFSTAAAITNLSGRGVGMDVVKRSIESLRGTIDIASTPGMGTTMTLHLPLTLAIIECMLVRVGEGSYAIPLSVVEECIELPAAEVTSTARRNFLDVRGELVPYLRLRDTFGTDYPADLFQKVVIVGQGRGRVGLVVDQIIGNTQTVIKSLSRFHAGQGSFSGATILGDGNVALILDVGNLIVAAQKNQRLLGERAGEVA